MENDKIYKKKAREKKKLSALDEKLVLPRLENSILLGKKILCKEKKMDSYNFFMWRSLNLIKR